MAAGYSLYVRHFYAYRDAKDAALTLGVVIELAPFVYGVFILYDYFRKTHDSQFEMWSVL
jgi:hypothetical protein